MRKSTNMITTAQLLPPEPRTPESEASLLARLARLEALASKDTFLFEPSFRSKAVSDEIRRLQTMPERRLHAFRFQLFGCYRCGTKKVPHGACAHCWNCYQREVTLRKRLRSELEHSQEPARFTDLAALAKKALRSAELPAKRLPALKGKE